MRALVELVRVVIGGLAVSAAMIVGAFAASLVSSCLYRPAPRPLPELGPWYGRTPSAAELEHTWPELAPELEHQAPRVDLPPVVVAQFDALRDMIAAWPGGEGPA